MDNIYDRATRYRVMTEDGYEHFATWHSAYKYAMWLHADPEMNCMTVYIDKVRMLRTWEIDEMGEVSDTYTWDK